MMMRDVLSQVVAGTLNVSDVPKLVDALAKLQTSSVNREKFKQSQAKKVNAAADNVEKAVGKKLSPETIKYIKEQIYGLAS